MPLKIIFHEWHHTLSLFSKKEFLIFLFGWIKTFKRSSFVFLKYFWWLLLFDLGIQHKYLSLTSLSFPYSFIFIIVISFVTMSSIYFALLSIRASVEAKNLSYFAVNLNKAHPFIILFTALFCFLTFAIGYTSGISHNCWALSPSLHGPNLFIQGITGLFLSVTTFFLLDNTPLENNSLSTAIKNSIKALLICLPFLLLLFPLYLLSFSLLSTFFSYIHHDVGTSTSVILLNFFFTCALAVLYLKVRHRNYMIFFNNQSVNG